MNGPTPEHADPRASHSDAGAARSRTRLRQFQRYTYWSLVAAVIVLLVLPAVTGPLPRPPDPFGTATFAAVLVVVVAAARLTERYIPRRIDAPPPPPRRWRLWAVVGGAASVAVAAASVRVGEVFLWAFAPAMIASLLIATLPRGKRHVAVAAAAAVAASAGIALTLLIRGEVQTAYPVNGAVVTAGAVSLTLASIWTWDVVAQLDAARRKAATLAVANERLRFAADLHDIQGHHLQAIALKSELAGRLLRADLNAAERELGQVHELATDALRDTRAVVHGYRRTTLEAEITNASNVLASAGIDARLRVDPDLDVVALPENSRHLLGLVLREAVTNVLRHSTATRADVTLTRDDQLRLSVSNDGVDDTAPMGAGGLHDLAERLRAAGGTLTWERTGGRFTVRTELPAAPDGDGGQPTRRDAHEQPG